MKDANLGLRDEEKSKIETQKLKDVRALQTK
jgi:hypothetical protein